MMFNKFNKKGDLSINMVIVAAIAILVLIVMVMIFSGKMRTFGGAVQDCDTLGGFCSGTTYDPGSNSDVLKEQCANTRNDGGSASNYVIIKGTSCEEKVPGQNTICCKRII